MRAVFDALGFVVLERGWLSSNNLVFIDRDAATVVDTGYHSHAEQTVELVRTAARGRPLQRIVNTHLHSDHCGGNAALQRAWGCEVWVPAPSFDAAARWDPTRLSFEATGQRCERFTVQRALAVGERLRLGRGEWEVIAAPGHDDESVMLFEPVHRVLISADALWADGLAIVFPEIAGDPGFAGVRAVLETIERLAPRLVIPGHGAPFTDVARAIAASRSKLEQFERAPERHLAHAMRSLVAFHMLEIRSCGADELLEWMLATPIFAAMHRGPASSDRRETVAAQAIEALEARGRLVRDGRRLSVTP